jgi:hypothetical protein
MVTALAVGMLPVLAACGGSGDKAAGAAAGGNKEATTTAANGATQLTVPDGVDAETKKHYVQENAIAVCMKKQGFTYTVYPDDPNAPFSKKNLAGRWKSQDHDEDGLTEAQKKTYDTALAGTPKNASGKTKTDREETVGGCQREGRAKAYGPELSAAAEKKAEQARNAQNHANGQALNGDPELVQLAQQFGSCLTGQGIQVTTTQPTGMVDMVRLDISRELPENFSSMSKEEALPKFKKDIDIALKDLDCGKKFRAAYFTKEKAKPYYGEDG